MVLQRRDSAVAAPHGLCPTAPTGWIEEERVGRGEVGDGSRVSALVPIRSGTERGEATVDIEGKQKVSQKEYATMIEILHVTSCNVFQ
jgi:hypothetical protein